MGTVQDQEIDIIVCDSKEERSPQTDSSPNHSSTHQNRGIRWWIQIVFYSVSILLGQSTATLLGRLYYDKGGKSKWMTALMQLIGFPLLLPLYFILPREKTNRDHTTKNPPSPFKAAAIYIFLGILRAAESMFYSTGLQYLPVSTFSLICASQLAFNALFSFLLNSQNFTPYIVNSLVLLTISSILLAVNSDSSLPKGVSKVDHVLGFICAFATSAVDGLSLSLTQLAFKKILKKESFKAILDIIVYEAFIASCTTAAGLFASGDWKSLKAEMEQFELGKLSYLMTLIWIALTWQVYSIGSVGLILKVSSLFSNVIATFGLPIVPVLAVIFLHDTMDGIKMVAMLLGIWGFLSYAYQQYLDHYKTKTRISITAYATEASGNQHHKEKAPASSSAPLINRSAL